MNSGFLFRRLGFLFSCFLRTGSNSFIKLSNKHDISSFQDVYLNPFYWDALLKLNFVPKTVFDLGANYGLFTSLCQQIFSYKEPGSVINYTLVEANKNLIGVLEKAVALGFTSDVNIKYGAAGPVKNIFFKSNNQNLLASKIAETGVEVPYVNFRDMETPDLLKIDIEGAELLLFENYFEWVKCAKAIIIEFHYNGNELDKNCTQLKNESFELTIDRLEDSGFRNQLWIKRES